MNIQYSPFKITHQAVLGNYPWVKKVFVAYPFMFVYKIVKYGVLLALGKRPNLGETIAKANERKSVYEKLHVFETEKEIKGE